MILTSIGWFFEVVLGEFKFNIGKLQISKNMGNIYINEKKNDSYDFSFHGQTFSTIFGTNASYPCFLIPLVQEVEIFIRLFVEHMWLLSMVDEKRS